MDRITFLKLASMLSVALLIGCTTVGPDYEQPETEVPDAWHTAATEGLQEGEATLQTWWRVFDDELLDDLIWSCVRLAATSICGWQCGGWRRHEPCVASSPV